MATALVRAWLFIRHYWYLPIIAAVAFLFFIVERDKKVIDWGRVLKDATTAHAAELKAVEDAQRQRTEADQVAVRRMQDAEDQVRQHFERNERVLDAKKEKRVRDIIKKFKDDPQALQNEIEKETGARVFVV